MNSFKRYNFNDRYVVMAQGEICFTALWRTTALAIASLTLKMTLRWCPTQGIYWVNFSYCNLFEKSRKWCLRITEKRNAFALASLSITLTKKNKIRSISFYIKLIICTAFNLKNLFHFYKNCILCVLLNDCSRVCGE